MCQSIIGIGIKINLLGWYVLARSYQKYYMIDGRTSNVLHNGCIGGVSYLKCAMLLKMVNPHYQGKYTKNHCCFILEWMEKPATQTLGITTMEINMKLFNVEYSLVRVMDNCLIWNQKHFGVQWWNYQISKRNYHR